MLPNDEGVESQSPALKNGCKSNGVEFSDCDQVDENLISSPTTNSPQNDKRYFGWCGYQPKSLQSLLSAKWALFWMCWAGALQGKKIFPKYIQICHYES